MIKTSFLFARKDAIILSCIAAFLNHTILYRDCLPAGLQEGGGENRRG